MVSDRIPQPLKFQIAGPNATDSLGNEIEFPLILPRKETANTRIVTEVLAVQYDIGGSQVFFDADADGLRIALSYRALTAAENDHIVPTATLGHEAIVDCLQLTRADGGTAGNYSLSASQFTHPVGPLIFPGNKLFVNITTDVNLSTHTLGLVVWYRQKLVNLTEFMGILAARQQN